MYKINKGRRQTFAMLGIDLFVNSLLGLRNTGETMDGTCG